MSDLKAGELGTSSSNKIRAIEAELVKRRDEQTARRFASNVVVYASTNKEPDYSGDDMMQKVWEKTKEIVDEQRALLASEPKVTQKELDKFRYCLSDERYDQLSSLAKEVETDLSRLAFFFNSTEGASFSEESYRVNFEAEGSWASYEDFLEEAMTGMESMLANRIHYTASSYRMLLDIKELDSSFDEALRQTFAFREKQGFFDWDCDYKEGDAHAWIARANGIIE